METENIHLNPADPVEENLTKLRDLIKRKVLYAESLTSNRDAIHGFTERILYVKNGNELIKIGKIEGDRNLQTQKITYKFNKINKGTYEFSKKENKVYEVNNI